MQKSTNSLTGKEITAVIDGKRAIDLGGITWKIYIHPPRPMGWCTGINAKDDECNWVADNFVELIPTSLIYKVAYSDMGRGSNNYREGPELFQVAVEAARQIAKRMKLNTGKKT